MRHGFPSFTRFYALPTRILPFRLSGCRPDSFPSQPQSRMEVGRLDERYVRLRRHLGCKRSPFLYLPVSVFLCVFSVALYFSR